MRRLLRLCILSIATIGLSLQANSFVNQAYGAEFTPQQKVAIILEGSNRTPQQLSDICSKNGISESTYNEWKKELLASDDPFERAMTVRDKIADTMTPRTTRVIGLGSDVFTEDNTGLADESWKIHTSFKLWAAEMTERNFFAENHKFKDMTLLGGPAIGFSKGKHAISVSVLAPLNNFDDDATYDFNADGVNYNADGSADYYIADVRYHRTISNNVSLFVGYKASAFTWKFREHLATDGSLTEDMEQTVISHGPIFGTNVSLPIPIMENSPFSLWGSVAYGPGIINHYDTKTDLNNTLNSDAIFGWYINPEVGIRYNTTGNIAFNVSYRNDVWGDYQAGPLTSIGGAAATISYSW